MKKSFVRIMVSLIMVTILFTGCGRTPTREEAAGEVESTEEDTVEQEDTGDIESTEEASSSEESGIRWDNIERGVLRERDVYVDFIREINPDYDYPEEYETGYDFYLDAAWNRLTLGDDGSICDTEGNPIPNYSGVLFIDATTLMIGDVYIPGYFADESSKIIKIVDEFAAASVYYVTGDMFTDLLDNMVNFPEDLDQSYAVVLAQCSYSYPDEGGFALVDDYGNTLIASSDDIPEEGDWVIVVGVLNTLEDPQYIDAYSVTVQPSL